MKKLKNIITLIKNIKIIKMNTSIENCLNIIKKEKLTREENKVRIWVRNNQKEFFGKKTVGTDKKNGVFFPNFKKTADLFNLKYISCKSLDSLNKIVKKIFSSTKPVIIEVFCSDTVIIPTVKSSLNKKGKLVSNPINVMFPYINNQQKWKHY